MSGSHPRARRALVLSTALLLLCLAGCVGSHRQLNITEVGTDKIELYLDEQPGNRMALADHELMVTTATQAAGNGPTTRMSLSAFGGSLEGGQYVVIWEEQGYADDPVAAEFIGGPLGRVPGIKVRENFFASLRSGEAAEVRVQGRHDRGMVYDLSNDCVRFGDPTTRPVTGGTFYDNGAQQYMPRSSTSIHRKWDLATGKPTDEDREDDLLLGPHTWGARPQ